MEGRNRKSSFQQDFGRYQIIMMLITQLGYLPVTSTMLMSSFLKPEQMNCNASSYESEFHSLLMEWDRVCDPKVVPLVSTSVTLGALVGACVGGYLSDRYGRKPIVVGSLFLVAFFHSVTVLLSGSLSWYYSLLIFFFAGTASGSYMSTNLVLLVESLSSPSSRFLTVTLNGWSPSMILVALLGHLSGGWWWYHMVAFLCTLPLVVLLHFYAEESTRWLKKMGRNEEYVRVTNEINRRNRVDTRELSPESVCLCGDAVEERFSYMDLFRDNTCSVFLTLAICFFVNSLVSFGYYFSLDVIPGNRFLNMGVMGVGKFLLGMVPFVCSHWIRRKYIMLTSVGICTVSSWALNISGWLSVSPSNVLWVVLPLVISTSLDPTWKVCHLYSTELFPTRVRSRARGLCNAAARMGTVVAPMVISLKQIGSSVPPAIFMTSLSIQLLVSIVFLPSPDTSADDPTTTVSEDPRSP